MQRVVLRTVLASLAAFLLLTGTGSAAGAQGGNAPATCNGSNTGDAAQISYSAVAGATEYVISRSVNGGATWQRGTATTTSYSDTLAWGDIVYSVQARGANGALSAATSCAPTLNKNVDVAAPGPGGGGGGGGADAPVSCAATNVGTAATLSWPASANAVEYRIYRTVNGGTEFWRGRTDATSIDDTMRGTGIQSYLVQAKGVDGMWSGSTMCSPSLNPVGVGATAPASCSASAVGDAASISWDAAAGAVDYRVFRSVNGGTKFWRGRTAGTVFDDSLRATGSQEYSVQAKGANGVWSTSTNCAPALTVGGGGGGPVGGGADAPVSCSASNVGTAATLSWPASANAVDYRIYRTVNGGSQFWRGRTADTSFDDTLRSTGMQSYAVQAKGGDGVWSGSTMCSPSLNPVGTGVVAPASCSASANGDAASISWTAAAGAVDYRVFRSVNGGTEFWRGRTAGTSFDDTLRPTGSQEYSVQAKGDNGVWTTSTNCAPALTLGGGGGGPVAGGVDAPASCSASNVGSAATISWTASANAVDYRIYRAYNNGGEFWRGRTSSTSFDDTLRASGDQTYKVQAKGADGVWSSSTTCSPVLNAARDAGNGNAGPGCSATKSGTNATITWTAVAGAVDYRVSRSINGGPTWFRGSTNSTSYTEGLGFGTHVYSVVSVAANGTQSPPTICSPDLVR